MGPLNVVPGSALSSNYWTIAGKTFQYAGAMAGLLGCGEASAAILEDRDSHRFELKIVSRYHAGSYLLSKLMVLLVPFFIVGIALALLSFVYCRVTFGMPDPAAFFAAMAVIYLPVVLFAISFGLLLSTVTQSRFVAVIPYVVLWVVSFLWLPEPSSVFDVTGESLYTAYFDIPLETLVPSDYGQIAQSSWDAALELSIERRLYGSYNIVFLDLSSLAMLAVLFAVLCYRWTVDAHSLLPAGGFGFFRNMRSSRILAFLKATRAWRLGVVIGVVLLTGLLRLHNDNPFPAGVFSIESFTALCFVFIFSGLYSHDSKSGLGELLFTRPPVRRYYLSRIAVLIAVMLFVLTVQAFQWYDAMSSSPMLLVVAGFSAALFFSGLAFILSVLTRNETTTNTLVTGIWLFLQLPGVKDTASRTVFHWVYPFQLAMTGNVGVALVSVSMVSITLFLAGIYLVGRPGFILRK